MMFKKVAIAAATVAAGIGALLGAPAASRRHRSSSPLLVYRTGPVRPAGHSMGRRQTGLPEAGQRRGGINAKIAFEECRPLTTPPRAWSATSAQRTRAGGTASFDTSPTGITFAVSDKAPGDKATIVTAGYGLSQSADGRVSWSGTSRCWAPTGRAPTP